MIIGFRLHACITAVALDVPVVGMIWDDKSRYFAKSMEISHFFVEPDQLEANHIVDLVTERLATPCDYSAKERLKENSRKAISDFLKYSEDRYIMNGLLKCSGESTTKNLGDYIQTVAQEQFWNTVDCYVEREELNTVHSDEPVNVIMNGWYMWRPKNFPPSDCINPLFTSIHINPKCAKEFFSEETIAYLKRYEPIGARDKGTQTLLEQYGIKSYYSSCLTLTLGEKYKTKEKNGKTIFIDPYIFRKETTRLIAKSLLKACWHLLKHPVKAHRLAKKIDYAMTRISNYSRWIDRHLCMATFYETYSHVFEDDFLFNAEYMTHTINNVGVTDDEKMELARERVKLYAGAKLVVTSRIHAALPCLGVETPVIFIPSSGLDATRENAGRFDGLEEMFHVIRWVDGRLNIESKDILAQSRNGKIQEGFAIVNSNIYQEYAKELTRTVEKYCSKVTNRNNMNIKITPPYYTVTRVNNRWRNAA